MTTKQDIALEISNIFDKNQLEDLKRFLSKRQCLNFSNTILIYIFHVVQTSGILLTTIAAGYDIKALVWVGAGVNALASLIKIFETTNNSILKKLMVDIKKIRDGTYVDEGVMVEGEEEKKQPQPDIEAPAPPPPPPPAPPETQGVSVASILPIFNAR
jgi:hypothetical protein